MKSAWDCRSTQPVQDMEITMSYPTLVQEDQHIGNCGVKMYQFYLYIVVARRVSRQNRNLSICVVNGSKCAPSCGIFWRGIVCAHFFYYNFFCQSLLKVHRSNYSVKNFVDFFNPIIKAFRIPLCQFTCSLNLFRKSKWPSL